MSSFEYILSRNYDGKIYRFYTDHRLCDIEELKREYDEERREYAYVYLYHQFWGPMVCDEIILKEDEWTQEKENKIINDIIHRIAPSIHRIAPSIHRIAPSIHNCKPGLLNRLINCIFR